MKMADIEYTCKLIYPDKYLPVYQAGNQKADSGSVAISFITHFIHSVSREMPW